MKKSIGQIITNCLLLAVLTIGIVTTCNQRKLYNHTAGVEQKTIPDYVTIQNDSTIVINPDHLESVFDYIFQLRLDHPTIVMAQCIEESGSFTSALFLEGNNCLGMKVPGSRPTHAVGVCRGHARFRSWHDCIADYAIWQSIYARNLTEDQYYALLDKIYAEKGGYSTRLKAIIQKYHF